MTQPEQAIQSKDYEEPACPFTFPGQVDPIPVGRVLEKLDGFLAAKDYDAAERQLTYWRDEAEKRGDLRGRLTVLNELIGLYRKTEKAAEGLTVIDEALTLAETRDFEGSRVRGTTYLNAATGLKAFGQADRAIGLYEAAAAVYSEVLSPDDPDLAGLYNNTAVTLADLGRFSEAETMYRKALKILERTPASEAEQAVTYCNLADLYAASSDEEAAEGKISGCLSKAEELLETAGLPEDGKLAFFLEKCAPVFGFYGWFFAEQKFMKRAEAIYERA